MVYRKFKNITSLLLLMVFLLPSIVKLEHHHEHHDCISSKGDHYREYHDECAVCNYDFSVISMDFVAIEIPKIEQLSQYLIGDLPSNDSTPSQYFFLLRAPPLQI